VLLSLRVCRPLHFALLLIVFMSRATCIRRLFSAGAASRPHRTVPGGPCALWVRRPIRPVVGRIAAACLLSLLAWPAIAAFAADTPNNYSDAATIYPSIKFASQASIAPPAMIPQDSDRAAAIDGLATFSQQEETPGDAPIRLISFQQPSNLAEEQVPPGMMLQQMVQQDTHAPDLNALANQSAYCPPPTASAPDVTGDYHCDCNAWHWQVLPQGIIYQSYMAGTKEPRFATYFDQNSVMGDMWDVSLGARAGIFRYGNDDPNWPEGWQLDIEGGVFPRLDPQGFSTPLIGDDFRFGIPLTYGGDRWEFKMGYYHISAHLGDEYLLYVNPLANRINYVRDSAILGAGYFFTPSFRTYGEVGYAAVDGGAKPVELQFGCEWMQARNTGFRGGPFAAINGDLRQEVDYGGNVSVQFGWMWRQYARGSNFRIGGQYFYGKDDEYEFFNQTVSRFGWGMWYDF